MIPRELGKLPVSWPEDELGVIVIPREVGELIWKDVHGVGTVLVAAEEGVLEELPRSCSGGVEAQELYAAGDPIAEFE